MGVPWITYTIIFFCAAIFAFLNLGGQSPFYTHFTKTLVPSCIAIWSGAYWGLLTSGFVHFDFWHILFNMWWLKDFGTLLEPTMGRVKYLMLIITAAVVGSGAQLAFSNQTGIGFSGVVYAMFGYALAARHAVPRYQQLVTKQTIRWLSGWLLLCIVLTVFNLWNVANAAHVAGFLLGYCVGNAFTARVYIAPSRIGLAFLIVLATLSAVYMPWSQTWKLRDAEAYFTQGIYHHKKGQYDEAISDYTRVLEMNPRDSKAYNNRGIVYGKKGQYDRTILDFTKAIEIDPRDAEVYNRLAWLLATAKEPGIRNGKKALELALKACELSDWKDPEYLDTLAAAYARLGDFDNAVKWQEKAFKSPEFAEDKEAQQRLTLYRKHKSWPPD